MSDFETEDPKDERRARRRLFTLALRAVVLVVIAGLGSACRLPAGDTGARTGVDRCVDEALAAFDAMTPAGRGAWDRETWASFRREVCQLGAETGVLRKNGNVLHGRSLESLVPFVLEEWQLAGRAP